MDNLFDFSKVSAATQTEYLKPGFYNLSISDVKFEKKEGATPYLTVTFTDKNANIVKEKFFLTVKAMPRLQYLHESWFSKKLEKAFSSIDECAAYFEKALTSKKINKNVIVGGTINEAGKLYAGLPFTNFILPEDARFEEGAFDEDSANYKTYVKKSTPNSLLANTSDTLLPDTSTDSSDNDEDMPW